MPDAEVPAAEMVLREEFAGRAKCSISLIFVAEEAPHPQKSSAGWYFFQRMSLPVLPSKQPFLSHIPISACILSDLPYKKVY